MVDSTAPQSSVIEHERLASLINSMADGVIALDEELKIVLYNGAALNVLNVNDSIQNRSITQILKLHDKNNQTVPLSSFIRGAEIATSTRDYAIAYDDGSSAALYISVAPVHLGYGKNGLKGYVLLLRDITHEKSLEEERDEFISVVSHELRTPITIAEGSVSNAIVAVERQNNPEAIAKALHTLSGGTRKANFRSRSH
jgi:PAS domain S-box-containing protein